MNLDPPSSAPRNALVATRTRSTAQTKVDRSPAPPSGMIQLGSLRIRTEESHGVSQLFLSGELDIATKPLVEKALGEAEYGDSDVVVDFKEMQFMDCSGIHLFLGAAKHAGSIGHRLQIVNCPASIRRVFDLTRTSFLLGEGGGDSRIRRITNRP